MQLACSISEFKVTAVVKLNFNYQLLRVVDVLGFPFVSTNSVATFAGVASAGMLTIGSTSATWKF
jgi:hypothetical protein